MRWVRIRLDPYRLGTRGAWPWAAWPTAAKGGTLVVLYDADREVVAEIKSESRELSIAIGEALEAITWALREPEEIPGQTPVQTPVKIWVEAPRERPWWQWWR